MGELGLGISLRVGSILLISHHPPPASRRLRRLAARWARRWGEAACIRRAIVPFLAQVEAARVYRQAPFVFLWQTAGKGAAVGSDRRGQGGGHSKNQEVSRPPPSRCGKSEVPDRARSVMSGRQGVGGQGARRFGSGGVPLGTSSIPNQAQRSHRAPWRSRIGRGLVWTQYSIRQLATASLASPSMRPSPVTGMLDFAAI